MVEKIKKDWTKGMAAMMVVILTDEATKWGKIKEY